MITAGKWYLYGVQAIEENVVQMFYNVYSSDPQNADSLVKVSRSHDSHVIGLTCVCMCVCVTLLDS